jgi:hypothetical protein
MKKFISTFILFFTVCIGRYINTDSIAYIAQDSSTGYGSMIYFSPHLKPIYVSGKNPKEVWMMLNANKIQ